MSSRNILISGASSGLGLAFLNHYASLASTTLIIAIDITPLPCSITGLSKIQFHNIDITNETQISKLAQPISTTPIDLIIHCAGVRGLVKHIIAQQKERNETPDVASAETYQVMDRQTFLSTFEVNTFGTFNLLSQFIPNLRISKNNPRVVMLSSRMGSVAANNAGGGYAYRASKAALNAVVKSFSIDVPEVVWCLLHPGRVETGLVEWKEEGAISVQESLVDCLKIIDGLGVERNGKLIDRFGVEIAW